MSTGWIGGSVRRVFLRSEIQSIRMQIEDKEHELRLLRASLASAEERLSVAVREGED